MPQLPPVGLEGSGGAWIWGVQAGGGFGWVWTVQGTQMPLGGNGNGGAWVWQAQSGSSGSWAWQISQPAGSFTTSTWYTQPTQVPGSIWSTWTWKIQPTIGVDGKYTTSTWTSSTQVSQPTAASGGIGIQLGQNFGGNAAQPAPLVQGVEYQGSQY